MLRSAIGLLGAVVAFQVVSAEAAPITLDRAEAVADARRDPGTGICGSVTKFANQPAPINAVDDAIVILNKPSGDPAIVGRVSRLFQNMNFSVGPGSEADFRAPSFIDDAFPLIQDPNAMPMGSDDNNIAMRLRGYININSTMVNQPQTIAVKCDDGCLLRIGKTRQLVTQANDDSPTLTGRRARWVAFKDAGLYPIEMIYFQNSTSGFMEWSIALGSLFSGDDVSVDNVQWGQSMSQFRPLSGTALYNSIVGSNPACAECGAPGMDCTAGSYCGDGLCQACNVPEHCGLSCQKCPADRNICNAGKCVQCTSDEICPPGGSCDIGTGACLPPAPCTRNDQCPSIQVCRPEGFCGNPSAPCKTDAECLAGQICDPGKGICCAPGRCGDFVPLPRLVATGCSLGAEFNNDSTERSGAFLALAGLSALATLLITKRASRQAQKDAGHSTG